MSWDDHDDQGQLPVEPECVGEQADDDQRVLDQRDNDRGCRGGDARYVEGEQGHDVAGGVVVEVVQRQALQLVEHLAAQIHDDVIRHQLHAVTADKAGDATDEEQPDQQQRQANDVRGAVRDKALVQQRLHQGRHGRFGRCKGGRSQQRHNKGDPVGQHIFQQANI